MEIMQRSILKVIPGKQAEAIGLLKQEDVIRTRLGAPPWRSYRCISGKAGEDINTFIFDTDWESLASFEIFFEKLISDPEMKALSIKWGPLIESHEIELYTLQNI